ncbi:MAG: mannosyltransferase family protein [Acidobacteriota bacterium]
MSTRSPHIPLLIRVLDIVTVVALLVAGTVWLTGGFREWTPVGRLSITSWWRPALVSLIVGGLRHWRFRRPHLLSRARLALTAFWASEDVRAVMPVFVGTRAGVLLAGFFAVLLFGYRPDVPVPWRIYENEFLNLPARWDTGWYLGVAQEGYTWTSSRADQQQNIAFFPLFPLLTRWASLLLARETMWTGVLISWVSFFGALVYLFRMARDRFGEQAAAAGVALLACYPFAVYFSTAYSEALFLLTIVASCYHFERQQWWRAAVWGLAAGLSRPNGCLLSVVLALMLVSGWRRWPSLREGPGAWASVARGLAAAAMPGVGMLAYSAFIYSLTGHPLRWAMQNAAWGRVYQSLDVLFTSRASLIGERGVYDYAATQTVDALYLMAVLFALATVWPVARRMGVAYAALIIVNVVPPLTMGGLLSMGRVTSILFPAFLWLGASVPASQRTGWIAAFAMGQAIVAGLFFTWRPLY